MLVMRWARRSIDSNDQEQMPGGRVEPAGTLCLCVTVPVFLCYRLTMRNLTVTVPDEVYRQARIRAAEQGRSVSSLVAEFLSTLSGADDEFDRLRAQQEEVLGEIETFRAGDRLDRDRLHDRALR